MPKKFLTNIDMANNEIQNAAIHPLGTPPTSPSPVVGQVYTNAGKLYVYDGTNWNTWGQAGGNAFGRITVGSTNVDADSASDTLTLTAGSNITLTPDATNDSITIAATNTKVTQTVDTTTTGTAKYPILLKNTVANTTVTDTSRFDDDVRVNPSNGVIYANGFNNVALSTSGGSPTIKDIASSTVYALDEASTKAVDTTLGTGSNLPTSSAVKTYVDNAISGLPQAMQFKGTLGTGGTITALPTAAAANNGYTYKVITAATYASQAAKVGDLFVSDGSSWILIPSGDEPSGTVTNIAVESPIITASGSAITSTGTIKHATSGPSSTASTSKGDTSNQTPGFGSTFKVTSGTVDKYGHTTAFAEHTVKIPNSTATTSAAGLMSATDKTNLDALASGSTVKVATGTISTSSTSVTIATGGQTSQIVAVTAHYTQQSSYIPVVVDWSQSTQTGAVTASISSTFSSALTVRVFYI